MERVMAKQVKQAKDSKRPSLGMVPQDIVKALDEYVIGQDEAKKKVAIALRTRHLRLQVPYDLRKEIAPKNILMVGPTGVGKTEIARRIASIAKAPFVKVEATKFTEVGYVGRDVDSIVRDLMEVSIRMTRDMAFEAVREEVNKLAADRVLDILVAKYKADSDEPPAALRKRLARELKSGELDQEWIELELSAAQVGVEIMAPPGMEEYTDQLQNIFQNMSTDRTKKRRLKVKDALKAIRDEESYQLVNEEEIRSHAIEACEQRGIVFLDELDKVIKSSHRVGGEVSREGVQRDLLPLLEGTTITTKYGQIKSDHILFIAAGAFMENKPSDMISELQGRLPIHVQLKDLSAEDFCRILKEPKASLIKQYQALMAVVEVTLQITDSGAKQLAKIAAELNEKENIGARRLHTVMEKCLECLCYEASQMAGKTIKIDKAYVNKALKEMAGTEDLRRWIL
jgi:ATP-dependent HslUV protease ATP-binding subunit HslU